MQVFYIPRDPRTEKIRFLTGHPEILKNIVNEKLWDETITEINLIIEKSSKLDMISVFYNLLVIPIFFMKNDRVEKSLHKYLKYRNNLLVKFGVFICHPKANQYTGLRCVLATIN